MQSHLCHFKKTGSWFSAVIHHFEIVAIKGAPMCSLKDRLNTLFVRADGVRESFSKDWSHVCSSSPSKAATAQTRLEKLRSMVHMPK